jgi:hypothetical protein
MKTFSTDSSFSDLSTSFVTNTSSLTATARPPICTVDFHNESLSVNQAGLSMKGAYYNEHYGNSWLLHHPGYSSIDVTTDIKKDVRRDYSLDLVHLSSLVNGQSLSQITIEVNGQKVVSGYNPNNGNYIRDSFDITPYIVDGQNTVRISFDSSSRSNYWIQSLAIQAK